MKIILKGEPRSTSHIYKMLCRPFPRMYMSKDGKDIKESYIRQAKEQYNGKPLNGDLEIWLNIYFGTKRKSDWDNFNKIVMDSLTGITWEDDSQIILAHVGKIYDKSNPRIEIEVEMAYSS